MGASNVKAVYARWGSLEDLPFRVLVYMSVVSHDGNMPRYWGGREALCLAAGRPVPDPARGNPAVAKVRKAAFKALDRIIDALSAAGAIVQTGTAYSGRNAEYALNLTGQGVLFDGHVLADPADLEGRCVATKRSGEPCISWPKRDTDLCVAHQEWTPVSGPNAPRSVDPKDPAEWTVAPRSVDLMHPAHRGPEEEEEQQEEVRTTSQDEYLDLDTDVQVPRPPAKPTKCDHGFRIRSRKDGTPDCALCRRETPCPSTDPEPATPPAAPHPTAEPTDASAAVSDSPPTPNPIPDLADWPTPSTGATGQHPDPHQLPAPSPPAPDASPPSSSATPTPAEPGSWPIVHIRQSDGRPPKPAELREDNPQRPNVVKIVYLASRTSAWVARTRIVETLEHAA
jgi:hypothetical protein